MKVKVDLTRGIDHDHVDFFDSTMFFDLTTILSGTISFKVWRGLLMPDFEWIKHVDFEKETKIKEMLQDPTSNGISVYGWGLITLQDVVAGKICISLYDDASGHKFLKANNGKIFELKKDWTLENIDENCYEYLFGNAIDFPFGWCDLKLYAKGEVSYEFDTDDCIKHRDFQENPHKYGIKRQV